MESIATSSWKDINWSLQAVMQVVVVAWVFKFRKLIIENRSWVQLLTVHLSVINDTGIAGNQQIYAKKFCYYMIIIWFKI